MSKGELHKKHHYVPQTYLKQFAHTNGKVDNPTYFLNACNRKAKKPYQVNVEDICQISHFYRISEEYLAENSNENLNPLSLEVEHFAEYVETNFTSILEEIHQRNERCKQFGANTFPMVENDKYLLAEQIIIQFLRHPKVRKSDLEFFDDFYPKMLRLFQQGLAIELNEPGIAELQLGIKKDDAVLHAKHSYLNDEILSSFTNDLSKNLWSFVYSPDNQFMTSDNPVVCIQQFPDERPLNLGLNQRGAIKFFAIFPDLLLIMMDETITTGVDCKFGLATDNCIEMYHNALCAQSDIVFSYNPFENNKIYMDKLRMKSLDVVEGNVTKIAALFPHCVTERKGKDGTAELAIDFDKLRAELSTDALDTSEERYQFTWPDKRAASRLANTPTDKTLRPDMDASVDFWNTKNLYIEGDNLDVLKVLRENYLGKVKMIYIDPPYNTGNDFVYNDDFAISQDEFDERAGFIDEDGNRVLDPMQRNTESNGRFHTDWLNMIYPRLKVARDLLAEDGAIYISMDDNEIMNLEKVCAEIFGEQNFVACIVWQKKYAATNDSKGYSTTHDYVLVYSKNIDLFDRNLLPRTVEQNAPYKYDDGDGKGLWRSDNILVKSFSPSGVYPIVNPNTDVEYLPPEGSCWRASQETMKRWLAENRIYFGKDGKGAPQLKRYLNEVQQGRVPLTWWTFEEVGHNDAANKEVSALFGRKTPFDTPKPTTLIEQMLRISSHTDSIILDFFSGSATTAHAVMKLNAEDGGHRKFIMVQLPEVTDEKSEARKAGYETICQIGEERIRRAGKKILEDFRHKALDVRNNALFSENSEASDLKPNTLPDVGFRVLKLDSSNMEDVFYTPEDFNEAHLFNTVDNVKSDRTPLDLLFQVMPELDIELSAKIEEKEVNGKKVFFVDDTYLIATFDTEVNESTVTEIAKMRPQYFVMRDSSAANDNVLDNFEQIFKHYSPDTIRKIL